MPRVRVLVTGGTIASTPGAGGYRPTVPGSVLLERALAAVADPPAVDVEEVTAKTSYMLSLGDVEHIESRVAAAVDEPEVDGVVLVMGTAAMEELGFLLDLRLGRRKPVVITGAMLNATDIGGDGPRNLADSIRYCVSAGVPAGVVIVMAGRAHAARYAVKLRRSGTSAFESDPGGPVATIDAERVSHLGPLPAQRHLEGAALPARVDVVTSSLGGDGRLLAAAIASGAPAVVIEGMPGGGGVPPAMFDAARDAIAAGVPVVLASRAALGRATGAAGGGSGPADLAAAGVILAHDLSAAKARILLMCCLAAGFDLAGIRSTFMEVAP